MRRWIVLLSFTSLGACNGVLGIEEAKFDPSAGSGAETDAATDTGADVVVTSSAVTCDNYCNIMGNNCVDDNKQYLDRDVCMAMCVHYDRGADGEQAGNSLACRVYHGNAAAGGPDNARVHCHHAGPFGAGTCGNPCDGFCLLNFAQCNSQNPPPYNGEADCRQKCETKIAYDTTRPDVPPSTDNSNTLNCRLYHLESAYQNPTTHCSHTGLASVTCDK